MGQYCVGTNVGGAIFGIVVRIVCRNLADIEGHVALTFDAIAIKLRRQRRPRGLQTLANAFSTFARRFAAEIRGAVVFAIGGRRAFRRHSAAAARAAARAAIAGITARTGGSTARTAARLLLWFGIIAASGELNPDEAQSGGNQPSSFQFHDKYSSRAAPGAANGLPTNVEFINRRDIFGLPTSRRTPCITAIHVVSSSPDEMDRHHFCADHGQRTGHGPPQSMPASP
jgi:hypothetical protein